VCPTNSVPAFDGAFLEFLKRPPMTSKSPQSSGSTQMGSASPQKRFLEIIQSPHVVEAIGSSLVLAVDGFGDPVDVFRTVVHDLFAPVHLDEPFIDDAEDEFVAGAPAVGIDVRIIARRLTRRCFSLEFLEDELVDGGLVRSRACGR
jgi:hypothetical protein